MLCTIPRAEPAPMELTETVVSIDDIYRRVQEERLQNRLRTKNRIVQATDLSVARQQLRKDDIQDTWSLPHLSSSPTYKSESTFCDNSERPKSAITLDVAPTVRMTLAANRCTRTQSAMSAYSEQLMPTTTNILSQQCCDVLGPRLCHECTRLKRMETDFQRLEITLPDLHTSEENFAATYLVRHYVPELNGFQAQTKLARGDIRRVDFQNWVKQLHEEKSKRQSTEKHKPVRKINGFRFFSNIRDLNKKIIKGQVDRKSILTMKPETSIQRPVFNDIHQTQSFSEKLCPMFVSPRFTKTEPTDKKMLFIKSAFEPPLLPARKQNVEPTFFAGSEKPYILPDRLPQTLVLGSDEEEDATQGKSTD